MANASQSLYAPFSRSSVIMVSSILEYVLLIKYIMAKLRKYLDNSWKESRF